MAQRLGDILLKHRKVTPESLQRALERQRQTGARLGEILKDMGVLVDEEVAALLAEQLGIPNIPPHEIRPDPGLSSVLPEEVARDLRAVPVSQTAEELLVAMEDPLDLGAVERITAMTKKKVRPAATTSEGIRRGLTKLYGMDPVLAQAVRLQAVSAPRTEETEASTEGPAVRLVDQIVENAIAEGASDVHWEPVKNGVRVRYRVDGVLRTAETLPAAVYPSVVARIKVMASMDVSQKRLPQDGGVHVERFGREVDIRVSTMPTLYGEKVVMRILDKSRAITDLNKLGFSEGDLSKYLDLIRRPHGMILVTGPTGCGKTTTLNATLHALNRPEVNIITIEDPIEYEIQGVNQVQVNPKAGLDFPDGLRAALRQDPNIIMVGEIRDSVTAQIAVRAALTGHLVLSTLHTNDAPSALTRLVDMGVEGFLVASAVVGVVAQRLVRALCSACAMKFELEESSALRRFFGIPPGPFEAYRAQGCERCRNTGYRGRLAIFEVLPVTPSLQSMVMEKAPAWKLREEAVRQGMRGLLQDGFEKALEGRTTLDEVVRVAFGSE